MYYDWNAPGAGLAAGAGIGAMLGGPAGAATGGATGALFGGIAGFFGKKKSRDVPDPLAGLRAQLQALAGQVPAQVAKQKEITAARVADAMKTGKQDIGENIHAERGFGNTSLQDELNRKLITELTAKQSEADLAAEQWGTKTQADILSGTSTMYPSETQLPEEEPWAANLLGAGAQMAVQNWQQEQQWKQLAKYFPGAFGSSTITPLH